jgi:hypothetical protein
MRSPPLSSRKADLMQDARSDDEQHDASLGAIRRSGSHVGPGPPAATWLLEHGGSIEQIGSYVGLGRPIAIPDLATWLLEHGRSIERIAAFVDELCWRAVALGLPLWRVTLHTATLHPQLAGLGCRWWRDRNLTEEFAIVLGAEESADFLSSPIRDSVLHGTVARFRLAQGQGRDYALLERVREGVKAMRRGRSATWSCARTEPALPRRCAGCKKVASHCSDQSHPEERYPATSWVAALHPIWLAEVVFVVGLAKAAYGKAASMDL